MVYDHVARAIAPSFNGYTNSFPATVNSGEQHTINFSFVLPTSWDENQIHIVGLLIDPQGRIDNAGKATITEAVSNGYLDGSNAGLFDFSNSELDNMVQVYPNPASLFTNIRVTLKNSSEVEVTILDLSGKVLSNKNYGLLTGNTILPLSTNNISTGVYIIETSINGKKTQKRLIVE